MSLKNTNRAVSIMDQNILYAVHCITAAKFSPDVGNIQTCLKGMFLEFRTGLQQNQSPSRDFGFTDNVEAPKA